MTDDKIEAELANFEGFRVAKDAAKNTLFAQNLARYEELLAARELRWGFRLEASEDLIRQAARDRRFLCYKDIADANGVDWNVAYRSINGHLWDLVRRSHQRFNIMVSALIVNKTHLAGGNMEPETLAGFVRAAEALGYRVDDAIAFLKERQEEIFVHFSKP